MFDNILYKIKSSLQRIQKFNEYFVMNFIFYDGTKFLAVRIGFEPTCYS